MAKIQYTGKQFVITVSPELMRIMGWTKGAEVVIGKVPEKDLLYIEGIKKKRRNNEKGANRN